MEKDEMLETTNDTENVDTLTTEELEEGKITEASETTETEDAEVEEEKEVKMFTQEELEKIVKERVFRQENKLRDEYEEKYGRLENVLNAGLRYNKC